MNPVEKKERIEALWGLIRTNYNRKVFLNMLNIMMENKKLKGVDIINDDEEFQYTDEEDRLDPNEQWYLINTQNRLLP